VHPYVTGAAHRIKYFDELYAYINSHDEVHWTGPADLRLVRGSGAEARFLRFIPNLAFSASLLPDSNGSLDSP
jgi:hypothetical protein